MKKFILLLLALPTSALAAGPTYKLLAPLGPLSGSVTLSEYLGGIMQVTIGIAGVLAVVMIVICGIQMIGSPSVSQKTASKECITNAIIGLLLAIGSWLILNTINSDLLKSDMALGDLPAVAAPVPPGPADDPMPAAGYKTYYYYRFLDSAGKKKNSPKFDSVEACLSVEQNAVADGATVVDTPAGSGIKCFTVYAAPPAGDEIAVRNSICGNDSCIGSTPVGINHGACVGGQTKGCTNVAGLPASAVNGIKAIGVNVIITGGTEPGHKTHAPGKPIFDLGKKSDVDNWIRSNSTQSAVSFWPCRYRLSLGGSDFWFTDEGDHWHVCQLNEDYWFCKDKTQSGQPLAPGWYKYCPK